MTGRKINLRLYTKLAWNGIQNNRQLYDPYLISGMAMAAVFYILAFLADSQLVHKVRGGGAAMTTLLVSGSWLIGLFSVPFLLYTSTALVKKRKKELGLYYILGMNRNNITVLIFWETIITYVIAVPAGIFIGAVFSKAAELGLLNIMGEEISYRIYIDGKAVCYDALLYAAVYACIFVNTVRQVRGHRPIELLHSDSIGEQPPKDRWAFVIVAAVMIVSAYVLACSIRQPREALEYCFIIAALIIAGTYLLFIAGSVFLCRTLQRNKRYYYQTSHFVMISSLTYRMKRNGAGLASICILSTAILVALTGSIGYYAGTGSIVERMSPYDLSVQIKDLDGIESYAAACRAQIEQTFMELGVQKKSFYECCYAGLYAPVKADVLDLFSVLNQEVKPESKSDQKSSAKSDTRLEQKAAQADLAADVDKEISAAKNTSESFAQDQQQGRLCSVRIMQLSDYNQLCGTHEELNNDEILIACTDSDQKDAAEQINQLKSWDGSLYTVKKAAEKIPKLSSFKMENHPEDLTAGSILAVTADLKSFWGGFEVSNHEASNHEASNHEIGFFWEYDADLQDDPIMQRKAYDLLDSRLEQLAQSYGKEKAVCGFKADKIDRMKSLTGGLMFLAFVICGVFVFVATLIMYYKQISEGCEDRNQFSIMQKIGMKKEEIRRSINVQMLTVFGFPLAVAGIHLVFMLPMIDLIMRYAVLDDKSLLIKVTLASYLSFAAAYAFVYKLTTRTYYRIVNKRTDS